MLLALDYGGRFIGVAITDYDGKIPHRHAIIDQKREDALATIAALLAKEGIKKVLVGLPISLEGTRTQQTAVTEQFIARLRQRLDKSIEIVPVDETLTSVEAEKHIRFEGGDIKQAHSEAARILLEDYLRQGYANGT